MKTAIKLMWCCVALFVVLLILLATGCTTYTTTLTNDRGQQVTCKASGKGGLVTGIYLRQGFEQCVNAAQSQGYHP